MNKSYAFIAIDSVSGIDSTFIFVAFGILAIFGVLAVFSVLAVFAVFVAFGVLATFAVLAIFAFLTYVVRRYMLKRMEKHLAFLEEENKKK